VTGAVVPGRVMVIGDLHHNAAAAVAAIRDGAALLAGEERKIALQAGDFGYWGQDTYLSRVGAALRDAQMELWFADGNHEDHDGLDYLKANSLVRRAWKGRLGAVKVAPRITWLSRGTRWYWHDRVWLAAGGAVSVDKARRHPGIDWFAQEEISAEQAAGIAADGLADVMLTHDCPSQVTLALPPPAAWWLPQIPAAEAHRERLQGILDAVEAGFLMHGHYHRWYERTVAMGHGPVRVTGLDMDGKPGNWMILDTATMAWDADAGAVAA
jgi:Calcineurin-like phosphoesterase